MKSLLAVLLACFAVSCNRPGTVRCAVFPESRPLSCTQAKDGRILVSRDSLGLVTFGPEGLGTILVEQRTLYFVNRKGETAPAFRFDNGADYVVDGLARTVRNGKVGFVNTNLEEVIPPAWDFASPFEGGVARVCLGCNAISDGEHSAMSGRKWGYIDKRGKVIVPVEFEIRNLPSVDAAAKMADR